MKVLFSLLNQHKFTSRDDSKDRLRSHSAMNLFNAVVLFYLILNEPVKGSLVTVNQNGGYENVLIAFSPEIEDPNPNPKPEDNVLADYIEEIKNLTRLTSEKLYNATRGKFYLESVSILVPAKWEKLIPSEYRNEATNEHYKDADIRVENPRSSSGIDLFTQQPRGCGQLGDFIQITTTYLNQSIYNLPNSALNLVREWSRLRFGVFEENFLPEDSDRFPPTYYGSDGFKVTGCIHPYNWTYNSDSNCVYKTLNNPCGFTVDKEKSYNSSLMDYSFNTVDGFCDGSPEHQHNSESPTPHNALCRESSTWEIISNSPDFKVANNQSILKDTTFKVVLTSWLNVMFIIDPALCSSGKDKIISLLTKSLGQFFYTGFPKKYYLGILFANSHANLELAPIPGDLVQLVAKLTEECKTQDPNSNDYLKALDKARELSEQKINLNRATKKPGLIILMADGSNVDTSKLMSTTFASDIRNKLIDFFLITFSTRLIPSTETPKEFVSITWYNIPFEDGNSWYVTARLKLNRIFTAIIDKYSPNFSLQKTLIYEAVHDVNGTGRVSSQVPGKFYLTIYSPDSYGTLTEKPNVLINGVMKEMSEYLSYSISSTEISSTDSLNYNITFPRTSWTFSVAIWFEAINSSSMSFQGVVVPEKEKITPPLLLVYTSVENPLVTATIRGPKSNESKIHLLPAGSHVKSDKKIYSRYFTNLIKEPGLYEVSFTATDSIDNPSFILRSTASFYSFMTDKDMEQVPPNRITDFRMIQNSITDKTVKFSWTAPGEHLDSGTATSYTYQCATNKLDLEDETKYQMFNKTPEESGTSEEHNVEMESYNTTYFCAVKSKVTTEKRNELTSDRSNIVTVHIVAPPVVPTQTTKNADATEAISGGDDNSVVTGSIVGGVLGFLFLIIIIIIIILLLRRRKRRQKESQNRHPNNLYTGAEVVRSMSQNLDENKNIKEDEKKQKRSSGNMRDSWIDIPLDESTDIRDDEQPPEKDNFVTQESTYPPRFAPSWKPPREPFREPTRQPNLKPIRETTREPMQEIEDEADIDPYATSTPLDLDRDVGTAVIHRNEYRYRDDDDDDVFGHNKKKPTNKSNAGGGDPNLAVLAPNLDGMYTKVNKEPKKNNFSTFKPSSNTSPPSPFAATQPMFEEMDAAYSGSNNRNQAEISGAETTV